MSTEYEMTYFTACHVDDEQARKTTEIANCNHGNVRVVHIILD